jgi:IS5 family transposase
VLATAVSEGPRQGRARVVNQFYRKVGYRGIEKNGAQLFALFALANIFLARSRLASA